MTWTLHVLEAEGSLAEWRNRLIGEATLLHQDIAQLLAPDVAMPGVDIVIQHVPGQVIPELGLGGYCLRRSCMFVTVDPANPAFAASVEIGEFRRMIAHEYHHCLRNDAVGYGRTLGEALVSEGLADHFDRELHGGDGQPWNHAVAEELWDRVVSQAGPLLKASEYDHVGWFYGRQAQADRFPRWAGYTLGYHLLAKYLRQNPGMRPSRMAGTLAADILAACWPPQRSL